MRGLMVRGVISDVIGAPYPIQGIRGRGRSGVYEGISGVCEGISGVCEGMSGVCEGISGVSDVIGAGLVTGS